MLDVVKMKDTCRICARELCGNQRRWIFHPGSKLSLQVLLSHALGQELTRDGRGEFACSKCAFMLDRMYRFDTVVARVEVLSLERLHKLLQEKERLRQCIGGLYRRNNPEDGAGGPPDSAPVVDLSALREVRYSDLIQDDLALSVYESWADKEDPEQQVHQCTAADSGLKPRRCRGCAALRVTDSDYEAVCKVPRRMGRRSTSCGPSTRYSTATLGGEDHTRTSAGSEVPPVTFEVRSGMDLRTPSPASSVESLDLPTNHKCQAEPEPEEASGRRDVPWDKPPSEDFLSGLDMILTLLRTSEYRPVKSRRGSKLPVLVKAKLDHFLAPHLSVPPRSPCGGTAHCELYPQQAIPEVLTICPDPVLQEELRDMEEDWLDDYLQFGPVQFQQVLMDEQQGRLGRYERAAGQCVGELQKAQNRVCSLQAKIRESETRNQKLQERLAEMELELRSAREEAQQQERNVQNLTDAVGSREAEVSELYRVIEEQNKMLSSLRDLQRSGSEAAPGQTEVLALQASLFQAQLELQAGQRAQRQAARAQEVQNRALERLEKDLQGALQHRRETDRHNQELQLVLQKVRSALQENEEQLRQNQQERQREDEEAQRTIKELRTSLQTKEKLVEEYCELLEDPKGTRDSQVLKLRQRITERDRALERAVDEKFRSVEQKEEELHGLQLLLRERDRDLDRQRCVLSNNEETIASLEALLRGKVLELDRVSNAWRTVQRQQQDGEDRQNRILREKDAIVGQLQEVLHARTQEAQELRCSLLPQVHSAPGLVLEELKVRLQLKDRLFQEVLADQTRQAQEHQEQVQDLLRTISCRDQYIQDSTSRLGEVLAEQASRLQELRRQLSSGSGSQPDSGPELQELQELQEELRLALRREQENRAAQLASLSRSLNMKEETIRDLQRQLADPSDLPLVERLTQEVQELREILVQQDAGLVPGRDRDWPNGRQPEFGGLSSEDNEDLKSEVTGSVDEGDPKAQDVDGPGLTGVQQLLEQKQEVENQLRELKTQLDKSGFSSLSHMRKALFSLQAENEGLKQGMLGGEKEEEEEEESCELWDAWDEELSPSQDSANELKDGLQRPPLSQRTVCLQQQSRDLQERLMVSEATVQVQAEQLKDYRDLLTETAVQQDSKQVQVDLQDLGYETCGRSENEAERDGTSSPEFDDLEMCTSLDCGSQWWPASSSSSTKTTTQSSGSGDEASSLQRLVEDLHSQLSRSQGVIRGLQSRLRSLSTPGTSSAPRKVNWSSPQSGTEEDEGWQSSDGGVSASPRHLHPDKDLQELTSRVDALEDQLRKGGKKTEDGDSATWPGNIDSLIKAQARELSHLRQRLREGRGVCSILTQHLGDTTKAFEELLRANDVDYYMGQSFRDQLAQGSALAQRVSSKISGRDRSEDPDEKTELLAIRLSKELQQKDKVIESLRAKLNLHHHHRPDTPCSSHALSDTTDQSDRISYVSDEHGSTNEDPEFCFDVDGANELGLEETRSSAGVRTESHHAISVSRRPSAPPSVTSSHRSQSCLSCPSMHCSGSPHRPADVQSLTAPVFTSCHPLTSSSSQRTPLSVPLPPSTRRTQSSRRVGFCLAEVQQELQMLQKQLRGDERFPSPRSRPLSGFPLAHQQPVDPSSFLPPLSFQSFQPSPFSSAASSISLDAGVAMRGGAGLLESSALWEMTYGSRAPRVGADLSTGSSGYQSGTSHTGSDLMKEHLREIRSLRQRLEDSIQTNDRLRQQLEDKMTRTASEKGGPTNIYIQGLDSVSQLSSKIRLLKEENFSLQAQLKLAATEGSKEAEHLREAVLLEQSRVKEAELDAERWAGLSRQLQAEAEVQRQEAAQLKQDRLRNQETINRLQHEASVLQQQLNESRSLVPELQNELQTRRRDTGQVNDSFDPRELHVQLDHQLIGQTDMSPAARRRLFSENVPPLPVRGAGVSGASSPQRPEQKHREAADPDTSPPQAPAPGGSFADRRGCHALGHLQDFKALQQQLLEGSALLLNMEAALCSLKASQQLHQPSDSGCVRKLLSDSQTLNRILQEAHSLLRRFWRAALPDSDGTRLDGSLAEEVVSLRLKLSERETALQETTDRLRSSSLSRDSMERLIVSQLSRTRDVLQKAKSNLQVRTQEASGSSPPLLVGAS
ncbi:myomegalin isoform X2 [Kryptolebias marmoratus]|uniref:myomegalin isoform X2 n=1 Tax=Kryptolebias marmoratus TaxID=37003 RepID=UPI0007F8C211|nr:myomegalin isoform X2 [Kryptolebias marmoratus]